MLFLVLYCNCIVFVIMLCAVFVLCVCFNLCIRILAYKQKALVSAKNTEPIDRGTTTALLDESGKCLEQAIQGNYRFTEQLLSQTSMNIMNHPITPFF